MVYTALRRGDGGILQAAILAWRAPGSMREHSAMVR